MLQMVAPLRRERRKAGWWCPEESASLSGLFRASLPSCALEVMCPSSYRVNLFCCVAVDPVPGVTLLRVHTPELRRSACSGQAMAPVDVLCVPFPCLQTSCFLVFAVSLSSHIINCWRTRDAFPLNAVAGHGAPHQMHRGICVEEKCQSCVCFGSGPSRTFSRDSCHSAPFLRKMIHLLAS